MGKYPLHRLIEDHATARKCAECQQPAVKWGFTANKNGGINKSSRTPLCASH
jgi:hypothetical protein